MTILVAGASGYVGTALRAALRSEGATVRSLVRQASPGPGESRWDPTRGFLAPGALAGVDVVVNLAGENIGSGRWTRTRRARILRSRIDSTRTLVQAMAASRSGPDVLLNASAVGCYGDRGDEVVDEASPRGAGFLADVCDAWETEALAAQSLGVRTVVARFGVVLGPGGGALARMLPVFRLGLGGRLGSGRQWMSWVHLEDVVAALIFLMHQPTMSGRVNVTSPEPVQNRAFTQALGGVLRRPAVLPVPAWALRLALGRLMANETLLASTRAVPQRLQGGGFRFRHAEIAGALAAAV